MDDPDPKRGPPDYAGANPRVGLCAMCRHVRIVTNRRGSHFYLCRLAESDPTFRRYPPLPVLVCRGFQPTESSDGRPDDRDDQ